MKPVIPSSVREFPVFDLDLAAFLKASGLKLLRVDRIAEEGKKHGFVFEDRSDREELVRAFFNEGKVDIRPFRHALNDLKSAIHNWR